MIGHTLGRLLLAAAAAFAAAPSFAGTIEVDPVRVEINADRKIGSVRVRNAANLPVTIRGYALGWTQKEGANQFEPASEVIVSPPVSTIPPGGSQLVRVGLRGGLKPSAYRLIIEEVPQAKPQGGIQVVLRLDMPVHVLEEPGRLDELVWSAWQQPDKSWILEASNPGDGYVRIDAGDLTRKTGLRIAGKQFGTVLPRSSLRWALGGSPDVADRAIFARIARPKNDDASATLASLR
jgi:fimbrial chaperone protein